MDGRFAPALSSAADLRRRADARACARRSTASRPGCAPHLGRLAPPDEPIPSARSTPRSSRTAPSSSCRRGVALDGARSTSSSLDRRRGAPTAAHPRTLVVAGRGSQATVVETYAGAEGGVYLTNAVTEIVLEDGARRRPLQAPARERAAPSTSRRSRSSQGRDSRVLRPRVCAGRRPGAQRRRRRASRARAASARSTACSSADGTQHLDTHTPVDHAGRTAPAASCTRASWTAGRAASSTARSSCARTRRRPTRTRRNRNLLLSREALVNSTPAARDPRRRREVQARLDHRPARPAGALLPALARHRRGGRASLLTYAFARDLVVAHRRASRCAVGLEAFLHAPPARRRPRRRPS